jgi:hypothetical protein
MSNWWDDVDAELAKRSEEAPDPWADLDDDVFAGAAGALSDEQAAFLQQMSDLPPVGRLDDDGVDD